MLTWQGRRHCCRHEMQPTPSSPTCSHASWGGQMKLTSLEQIEKDAGKPGRTVIEQSRLWLEQRSYEVAFLGQTDEAPPLRPGGRARLRDWQAQPELNGLEVELC